MVDNKTCDFIDNKTCDFIDNKTCDFIDNKTCDFIDNKTCDFIDNKTCDFFDNKTCDFIDNKTCDFIDNKTCDFVNNKICDFIDNNSIENVSKLQLHCLPTKRELRVIRDVMARYIQTEANRMLPKPCYSSFDTSPTFVKGCHFQTGIVTERSKLYTSK